MANPKRSYQGKGDSLDAAVDAAHQRKDDIGAVDAKALPNGYTVKINGVVGERLADPNAAYQSALDAAKVTDPSGLEVTVRAFYDMNNPVFPKERAPQATRPAGSYSMGGTKPLYEF